MGKNSSSKRRKRKGKETRASVDKGSLVDAALK
jgi:hypothetical protein